MSQIPLSSESSISSMRSSQVPVSSSPEPSPLSTLDPIQSPQPIQFEHNSRIESHLLAHHLPNRFHTHSLDHTRVYRSCALSPPAEADNFHFGDLAQLSRQNIQSAPGQKSAKQLSLQQPYKVISNKLPPVNASSPSPRPSVAAGANALTPTESSNPPPLPSYLESSCFSVRVNSTSSRQIWKSIQQYLSDQGMVVAESNDIPFELHCCVFSGTSTCEFHVRLYEGHYSQLNIHQAQWLTVELQRRSGCGMLLMNQVRDMLQWLPRAHDCEIESRIAPTKAIGSDPHRTPTPPLHADLNLYSNLFDLLCSEDENLQLEGLNSLSLCLESNHHSFMSSPCAREVWSEVAKRLCLSDNMSVQHAAAKLFEKAAKAAKGEKASVASSEVPQSAASDDSLESDGLVSCFPAIVAHLKTCAQSTSDISSSSVSHSSSRPSICHSLPRTPCTLDEACRKHVEKCLLRGCLALHSLPHAADRPSPQIMSQFKKHLFQLSSNSRDADVRSLAQANIAMAMR